jgi:hypothetical protein
LFSPLFLSFISLCFDFSLLSKKIPLFFNSQVLPILVPPPLVFIGKRGKGHLTPVMAQSKVGWEVTCRAWLPWLSSSLWRGGRVCVGMGRCRVFWASGVEREGVALQGNKCFFFPCLARLEEEEDPQYRFKRHCFGSFFFIFFFERNESRKNSKIGYNKVNMLGQVRSGLITMLLTY